MFGVFLTAIVTLGQPSSEALLHSARTAHAQGDVVNAQRALAAWRSLHPEATPPADLAQQIRGVDEALQKLRVFVSTFDNRVRVGVFDPAGLVSHVIAGAIDVGTNARRIFPSDADSASDRTELEVDPPLRPTEHMFAEALLFFQGGTYVLETVELDEPLSPPSPPVETVAEPAAAPAVAAKDEVLPWWFWVMGGIAAVGTAAAVWQETRF